jgi:glutathione synthase/RimK-type ligase-like ATP-grasp enzyme
MNTNLKSLIQACKELGVAYETYHSSKHVIELLVKKKSFLFVNCTTPLNSQSVVQLCLDKEFFHSFFHQAINMPRTVGFLKPDYDEKYQQYIKEKSYEEIISSIEENFQYPLIIKRNRGSQGTHVFKVNDKNALLSSITNVFNINSNNFDYVALAQDYIEIKAEYRAIYLNGSLIFIYEKNIENAIYDGSNLSRLHRDGAKAILVKDNNLLNKIDEFCLKLFKKMIIPFCGLDVVIDNQGILWLLEANSSPGFSYIIRDGGENEVIKMYKKIIMLLVNSSARE